MVSEVGERRQCNVSLPQFKQSIIPWYLNKEMGLSWGETQATAKDRTLWKDIVVVALCPTGDEEDK